MVVIVALYKAVSYYLEEIWKRGSSGGSILAYVNAIHFLWQGLNVTFPYVDMFVIFFDLGIQSEGLREIAGEVHKLFILNGRPWSGSCTDDEYIDSRFMFLQFLTNFAVQHWKVTNKLNTTITI